MKKNNEFSISNITIRKMCSNDIDKILEIENEQNITISTKKILEDSFLSNTNKYFVACYDSKLIGYFAIDILVDFIDILSIVVKEEYKRHKVASFLMENIISIANENNIAKLFIEVRKSNIPAKSLYNKFGFEEINIRKNYYNNPIEDAIILFKKLDLN